MVHLEKLIHSIHPVELREIAQERLDIIQHKIKFMDAVPVACIFPDHTPNIAFNDWVLCAGGLPMMDPADGVYVVFMGEGLEMVDLLHDVAGNIDSEWNAVNNQRIVLMHQDAYSVEDPMRIVDLIEDLAEILHPGSFIFGHEGDSWMRFSV